MVDSAEKTSERRLGTNKFYIGIVTLLFGVITAILQNFNSIEPRVQQTSLQIICVVGFFISYSWFENIRLYKQTNSAKYQVINQMEKDLPCRPFTREWQLLQRKNYKSLTNIESLIPVIFLLMFLVIFIGGFYYNFGG
jgi:hypothetical protein